jgi:tetratricopeptide (TPR) repeat protein
MKRSSSLLPIALCLLASAAWAQTSSPAKELAGRCLEKYKQNDKDGAMADCTKAIELDARSTDAYALRATILMKKGDFEGAIADLDKALMLDPRNPNLYRARGLAKLKKRDLDGSIADYDKAVEIDHSLESYMQRALGNFLKGNFDKAIADLDVAIEKSSEPFALYNLRAQAKFRKKDWGAAIIDYSTAIKLDPKFPDAYFYRGLTLLNQGKDMEAQRDFDKFLELAPDKKAFLEKWVEKTKRERTIKE